MARNRPSHSRTTAALCAAALLCLAIGSGSAPGQDQKPYDAELLRLAEILGSVHYLRELCGANEGQLWRSRMESLSELEGTTAERRARLIKSFNRGYRSYRRTYRDCTDSARTAVNKFLSEGAELADKVAKSAP